ncbi:MAG: capsule assembly Wzi family protein, partial [Candidatus Zixiibacteriota bacterium]
MKKKLLFLFTLLMLSIATAQAGFMETVPLGEQVYGWIYDYLDELYVRGFIKGLHMGTKPYFRGQIAKELLLLRDEIEKEKIVVGWPESFLVQELEKEFSDEINELRLKANSPENSEPIKKFFWGLDFEEKSNFESKRRSVFRETCWPYVTAQIGANFSLCTRYMLDENLAKDPDYGGKVWRGFAGDAAQAYLSFNLPYFKLLLGRDRLAWGQRNSGQLILSQHAFPLDLIKIQGGWGIFQGTAFFSILDPLVVRDSSETIYVKRYLSGHRVSLDLFSIAQLGFSETVLYGGKDRFLEAYYLIPLFWYHGAQLNHGRDDNTFFSLDFTLRPKKGVVLWVEFLMDDFQIEKKTQGDQEPNELGYFGGLSVLDLFGFKGVGLDLGYTRINNWTFNQKEEHNRYLHEKKLLGNPLGPDADNLVISLSAWLKKGLKSKITYQLGRHGEGRVNSPWNEPWMLREGEYKEKFPTGVVEKLN